MKNRLTDPNYTTDFYSTKNLIAIDKLLESSRRNARELEVKRADIISYLIKKKKAKGIYLASLLHVNSSRITQIRRWFKTYQKTLKKGGVALHEKL